MDSSRASQITETEDTVKPLNKTRSISSASLSDKSTKKQQPKIIITPSVSVCAYFEPLINKVNYLAFLQKLKINLDASEYKINIDANLHKPSEKRNLIVLIVRITGQHKYNIQFSGFLYLTLCNILNI